MTNKPNKYRAEATPRHSGDHASGTVEESVKSSFPKLGKGDRREPSSQPTSSRRPRTRQRLGHSPTHFVCGRHPTKWGVGRTVDESVCIGSSSKLEEGDRASGTVEESDRIASEPDRDRKAPTKMHNKTHPTPRTSSSWTLIRPKLDEIEKLIGEKFVPIRDVPTKYFGISYQTFLTLRGKHPELDEAVQRGKARRNELVLKGMYDLATGRAVRVEDEKAPDEKGNLRITKRRIIRFEPQADIGTTLMKQYAGWSDNPKTDNAVANTLNNKDWTATISLIPGFSDLSPKSSEADNFKAYPKDIGNRADAPAAQGENYNSDSLADQKEDNDDDSGE